MGVQNKDKTKTKEKFLHYPSICAADIYSSSLHLEVTTSTKVAKTAKEDAITYVQSLFVGR